jgi:Cu/Ag efflux protein CusF
MKRCASFACALALLVAIPLTGSAEETEAPAPMPGGAAADVKIVTATVAAIDLATRQVTLKDQAGETFTLTVGEEARNLDQVKVGDEVTFEFYQLLAVALEPSTTTVRSKVEQAEVARAPLGAKPAGYLERTVDVTGTVEAIDRASRMVTLRGPERSLSLHVDEEVDLTKIEVGQTAVGRYIEGFAVSVKAPSTD